MWWRLSNGPIQLDAFTPWLVSAIEENFGSRERVEVGGTQIERTANGGAAVRVRDIVVRDPDGTVVASAPKAEIRVSGLSLFSGHMRAESLNLVGAEMAVRIERDGNVTVFASGANKHPIATANVPAVVAAARRPAGATKQDKACRPARAPPAAPPAGSSGLPRPPTDSIAALLTWIDGIGDTGLDGHDLRELGLKDGTLTVDDERTGKRWTFQNITSQSRTAARRRRRRYLGFGQSRPSVGLDRVDQAGAGRLPQHRSSKHARFPPTICCWRRGSATAICKSTCRCRRACAARSVRTGFRKR